MSSSDAIRVWRCEKGHCGKLVSREMLGNEMGCPFCGFNKFTHAGNIGFFELLMLRIRHLIAERRLNKEISK